MVESGHLIRGMAYVPGTVSGKLHRGTSTPGGIALVDFAQALEPIRSPSAFIIVGGAPLSHAMIEIVARGIPTVIIDRNQADLLTQESWVSVDGATGIIVINGDEKLLTQQVPQAPEAGQPIYLADRAEVWLMASVRNTEQARQAFNVGASGIGLVRSEFLAGDALQAPDVVCLIREFENLCIAAGGLRVTIRLIDIAADKPPRWMPAAQDVLRPLGMQGSRLYRYEPIYHVLCDQLSALAVLSERYPIEVLIPFVGRHDELLHWVEFVRRSLPETVAIGAMAETPAAVLDLANWGGLADFFSIGTNDLLQFYFAADRDEAAFSNILDPYAPAVYHLLQQVADTAAEYHKEIRLCGVLPRLSGVMPVLVGLGFCRFSVDPIWIPYLAETLYSLTLADAEALARRVCGCITSKEVCKTLR
jgi:phosphoenolpyruvate-protein kinase (PTS system EI component)